VSEYITAAEAAEHVGCSQTQIRRLIDRGVLTATKNGRQWRILRTDLDAVTTDAVQLTNPLTDQLTNPLTDQLTDWRADLLAQVARLEADKQEMRDDFDARLVEQRQESGLLVESSKARIIDLERELTVRDSRTVDLQAKQELEVTELRGQVAVLEAKVREVLERSQDNLEKGQDEALQLANRIADLVDRQQEAEARIHELAPVAEQVPMLQAAVEEKDASLSERERELGNMRQDIDAIANRPVTGPVFRLLTKGRLRR
jgi:excisionase family DNA binding protein